jgi:hypothetical protein
MRFILELFCRTQEDMERFFARALGPLRYNHSTLLEVAVETVVLNPACPAGERDVLEKALEKGRPYSHVSGHPR